MALPDTAKVTEELPAPLRAAVAPLRKVALGCATGAVLGLWLCVFALVHMLPVFQAQDLDGGIGILEYNLFTGYAPTFPGALLGLVWGFGTGFVFGWLLAGVRNFGLAVWVAIAGAKEQLRMDQEFLDEL